METTLPTVYTITDASRRLNVSPSYLHRLIKTGRVRPSVPTGDGRRMLTDGDLAAARAELRRPAPNGKAA
jgi:hypothetical protein